MSDVFPDADGAVTSVMQSITHKVDIQSRMLKMVFWVMVSWVVLCRCFTYSVQCNSQQTKGCHVILGCGHYCDKC